MAKAKDRETTNRLKALLRELGLPISATGDEIRNRGISLIEKETDPDRLARLRTIMRETSIILMNTPCGRCNGTGRVWDSQFEPARRIHCTDCGGTGVVQR